MKRLIGVVLTTALLAGLASSPTIAGPLDPRIAAAGFRYLPAEVTITEGGLLEFTNVDAAPHDVTSLDSRPDGKPLFASDTVSAGVTVPVEGVEDLRPGVYDFTCTLHPQMLGAVYVESAGG